MSITIPLFKVQEQLALLGVPDHGREMYLYMYHVILDDKQALKIGYSSVKLDKRICQYLNVEHIEQMKSGFRMLAVLEFDDIENLKNAERMLKTGLKKHPLNKGQNGNTEQYEFATAWPLINDKLDSVWFVTKVYKRSNLNLRILKPIHVEFKIGKPDLDSDTKSELPIPFVVKKPIDMNAVHMVYLNSMTINEVNNAFGSRNITTAGKVIDYRRRQPFSRFEELLSIYGLQNGGKRYQNLVNHVKTHC